MSLCALFRFRPMFSLLCSVLCGFPREKSYTPLECFTNGPRFPRRVLFNNRTAILRVPYTPSPHANRAHARPSPIPASAFPRCLPGRPCRSSNRGDSSIVTGCTKRLGADSIAFQPVGCGAATVLTTVGRASCCARANTGLSCQSMQA